MHGEAYITNQKRSSFAMLPGARTRDSSDPPEGGLAFIVGPNHFQNVLFATYIESHGQWKCAVINDFVDISSGSGNTTSSNVVVIYDCFGLNSNAILEALPSDLEQLPPEWRLVLFNLDRQADIEKRSLEYGVHGFFYRDESVESMLKGLTAVFGGEFWVSRRKMADVILDNGFRLRRKRLANHSYPQDLTRREVEILGLLTSGASNVKIADKLCISPHTVRTHLNHIFRKIRVTSRLEASVWATETLFSYRFD
jgi:LuxR family transcriptional regulator of csgAB operon